MRFPTTCRALAAVMVLASAAAAAQETPTEREAARDVLAKMAALEGSLDVPALVATLTGPNADRDKVVARAKELMDKELLALADDIATHPEIGFEREAIGREARRLPAEARLQCRNRQCGAHDRVRGEIPPQ